MAESLDSHFWMMSRIRQIFNPRQHPRQTPISIVASSRLLLEVTFLRDQIEGTQENVGYYFIKDKVLLPLKGNAWEEQEMEPPLGAPAQEIAPMRLLTCLSLTSLSPTIVHARK